MTDQTPQAPSASRRQLLKGAVGAGVGLAAWNAPKIGTIPAYALTNSSGVFNGECYFLSWNSIGDGNGNQNWELGSSTAPLPNQGQADSLTGSDPATYTWTGLLPGGADLVVIATRLTNPSGGGTGTGTLALGPSVPGNCSFEIPAAAVRTRVNGNYTAGPNNCSPSGGETGGITGTGTYTSPVTDIAIAGIVASSGQNHVIFNIVCD